MAKQIKAVFADKPTLEKHNCFKEENGNIEILRNESTGWSFESLHSKIPNELELQNLIKGLKSSLRSKYNSLAVSDEGDDQEQDDDNFQINEFRLHIPPMIFDKDIMRLKVGVNSISINAADALNLWASQHVEENLAERPLKIVKVPCSTRWMSKLASEGFSTDASTASGDKKDNASDKKLPESVFDIGTAAIATNATGAAQEPLILATNKAYDWTFGSDYCCTINSREAEADGGRRILGAIDLSSQTRLDDIQPKELETSAKGSWKVFSESQSGIDIGLLRQTNVPILFYDEYIMYQDDLEDCGETIFEVKLRVMPTCWFVLSKLYVRVDGSLVRSKETRLFHKFSSSAAGCTSSGSPVVVHVEVTWREYSLGAAENDTNESPSPLRRFLYQNSKDSTHMLPEVSQKEGIHRFYTLRC